MGFTMPTHPRVPEAWRGNCKCGRWLVVLVSFTSSKPLRCECGRRWSIDGDHVRCEPGRVVHALCLDLDGTVRRSKSGGFISGPDDVELFPGVEAMIWRYRDDGFLIFGITNQGGVAHGHKTELTNDAEIDATVRAFKRNPFHMIKSCYHDARGTVEPYCHRSLLRKPGYGMLALCEVEAFAQGFIIDWDMSIFVGDRPEDEECARSAGVEFRWAQEFFGREPRG